MRRLFSAAGIRTVDADAVGHDVLDNEARDLVAERWPDLFDHGAIDRPGLAAIVFSDHNQLRWLESITHPIIFGRIEADLEGFSDPAVVEVPLLTAFPNWPKIVVDAPDQVRFERSLARGMIPGDVSRRMALQPTRAEWLAAADLVIPNAGSLETLAASVEAAVSQLRSKPRSR